MNVFLSFLSDDNWQGDPLTMREFESNGELFDANFFAFVRKIGSPDTIMKRCQWPKIRLASVRNGFFNLSYILICSVSYNTLIFGQILSFFRVFLTSIGMYILSVTFGNLMK